MSGKGTTEWQWRHGASLRSKVSKPLTVLQNGQGSMRAHPTRRTKACCRALVQIEQVARPTYPAASLTGPSKRGKGMPNSRNVAIWFSAPCAAELVNMLTGAGQDSKSE